MRVWGFFYTLSIFTLQEYFFIPSICDFVADHDIMCAITVLERTEGRF